MALTNDERIGKAMDLLRAGLAAFVERDLRNLHKPQAGEAARCQLGPDGACAVRDL
jgi:hypothetical protein